MNIEQLREYCLSLGEVEEKMPFGKFARRYDSTLVFYVMGHMFCLFDIDDFTSVSVRSTSEEIEEIKLTHNSVLPGRKNMRLWLNIELGGDISDKKLLDLVRRSYDIIREKYTSKQQNK